jgi:hypothetical protein
MHHLQVFHIPLLQEHGVVFNKETIPILAAGEDLVEVRTPRKLCLPSGITPFR